MALQFVLGGSGRGKTYYLQHYISKEAKMFPERQYIYVVPEQFTMQTQKAFIEISEEKGILNIDVQSFVRLAFRVFEETGAGNAPVLDDMGKTMVLKKVLDSLEDELQYFGKNIHKKGYVQEIKSFLSELYQYGADESVIDEMIDAAKNHPLLAKKLTDMKLIYQSFSAYLENHYITSEELLTVLADVVEDSALLENSIICLDGFTGFTPTQYRLIEKLLRQARKVYVTVTIDKRESIVKIGEKHKLFHMSQQTIWRLCKIAKENGIEVCPEIWTGENVAETRFAEAEDICALEERIYRYPIEKYDKEVQGISLHELGQPEDEIAFVAEQVRGLLVDEQCRYRDIAVVTGDLEVYGLLAKEIFGQAGIPCFIDQKKNILENPFVSLISTVIEIFLTNFKEEKVISFEKNIFSEATQEQTDLLDNFLRATGIRGYQKWLDVWDCSKVFTGISQEQKEYAALQIDTVRLETVEQLGTLYETIGRGKHSVREYAQALCEWFEEQKYFLKIQKIIERAEQEKEAETVREYSQIYTIVLEVLERLVELLGEEKMDLKEFKEILDTGFSEARVGLIPPGVDQVVVGDINRTRLTNIKYLFFLGMNDSNIPKSGAKGGVISDSERLFLAEEEFELAPTIRDNVYTEQFYLYLNLTKASKHLYLTYCETGNDGKAQNPAYIIGQIQKIFPQLETVMEKKRTDDRYLLGNDLGKGYLIQGLRDRDFSDEKWQEIYTFYAKDPERKQLLERFVTAAFYKENQSKLSERVVKALYHDILTGSTSQFERYAACAFSYFMRYGLHLKERAEHQVEFFDIGNIVHEALEEYTKSLIREGKNWDEIPEDEQHVRANQCINEVVERYKNGLLYSTERDTYLITRLRRLLQKSIWAITEQMKAGKFRTVDSEVNFEVLHAVQGSSVAEEMEQSSDGQVLRLIGRIDRVDSMVQGDASYIKIVDYKTGRTNLSLSDLYYGLQMQLMIYLKVSVEEERQKAKKLVIPAGMLYYHIDDPLIEGKASDEKIASAVLQKLRMDGLLNEDNPVLPSIDSSFATEGVELVPGKVSDVAPFGTNKNGTLKKTSKVATTKDFEKLMAFTDKKLADIRDEIMEGNISVNPYRKIDATDEMGCQYCPYHSICRFDTKIEGNKYRLLKKLSDDDVMQKIAQEEKNEA
ncbi:MAG: helicase-exonuclease AddAB subunit AddB [bacterium]|nr:helicase-exonuclease AddAB subunit AddB [bacterium]